MSIDRETLEQLALKTVSATNYFEISDYMGLMTDTELLKIIKCGGDYRKELRLKKEVVA